MKINLFSIPIFIGNINAEKIILENESFTENWLSKTNSSWKCKDIKIKPESFEYLMKTISELLNEEIKSSFEIILKNIWTNKYEVNSYQEEHLHTGSKFSFVIYKNVKESKTVFLSAYSDLIHAFEMDDLFPVNFKIECRSDQICVFPSFLKHMVLKQEFSGETISGNIHLNIKHADRNR